MVDNNPSQGLAMFKEVAKIMISVELGSHSNPKAGKVKHNSEVSGHDTAMSINRAQFCVMDKDSQTIASLEIHALTPSNSFPVIPIYRKKINFIKIVNYFAGFTSI